MKKRWIPLAIVTITVMMIAAEARSSGHPATVVPQAPGASRFGADGGRVSASAITGLPAGWSAMTNISKTSTDSEVAVGAVDNASNAYCAWTEWHGGVGARRDIVFTTNKSGSWSTPFSWTLDYVDIDDVGFPAIAVTPDGNTAVVAYHDGDFSASVMTIKYREYSNGTWSAVKNLSGTSDASSYVTMSSSPVDGTIYALWMQDVGEKALRYKYRDPATGAWSGTLAVNTGSGTSHYLPNIFVDKNGTAHLVYILRNGNASVWYTKNPTPKNPATWTTPFQVSADSGLNWTYPKVAADWDGDAYVVWQQMVGGVSSIMLRYMASGAWGAAANISNLPDLSETAYIAVNGQTNEFWVVWQTAFGYTTGNINWDVCMKTYEIDKATGQKAWSDLYRVTTYSGHAGEPQIKISKDGDLHLFFFDNPVGDFIGEIYWAVKMAPRLYAVSAPTVTSARNKVLFGEEKWNTVTFTKNADNDDAKIQEYRLYRKLASDPDSAFAVIATLNTSTFQYVDKKLAPSRRYAYMISVVNKDGLELKSAVTIEP